MKNRREGALALIASILIVAPLLLFNSGVSEPSPVTISVDPPTSMQSSGSDFTVKIRVEGVTDLFAWDAKLKWDPNTLEVVSATKGDFLPQDFGSSQPTFGAVWLNQSEGSAYAWFVVVPPFVGSSGNGTLANIVFHGKSLCECTIDLYDTKLYTRTSVWISTLPYPGDTNNDCVVNINDVSKVADGWMSTIKGQPEYDPIADFNKDGIVDFSDFCCLTFNFGTYLPPEGREAWMPAEIGHEANVGNVTIVPLQPVSWTWLDPGRNLVCLTTNVSVSSSYAPDDFDFNRSLGQLSFSFASATPGFCNVSVPKLLMDGAFKVLVNDTQVSCMLTWNRTHTFIYFTHEQGACNVAVIGEMTTRIRSSDLLAVADVNGDGQVNILDVASVATRFMWKENP
jgi:hypothetical protein